MQSSMLPLIGLSVKTALEQKNIARTIPVNRVWRGGKIRFLAGGKLLI